MQVFAISLLLVSAGSILQKEPSAQLPSVELPASLARVLTDYEAAWTGRNPEALSNLFAEDGFILPNGAPPVRGRTNIKEAYKNAGGDLSLRALAYSVEGSTGYIIGAFSRKKGEADVGKFTLTLKKTLDGKWLIMSDMDNGNRRPGPSPQNPNPPEVRL